MGLIKDGRRLLRTATRGSWLFPALLIFAATVLLIAGDTGREWFRFDRGAITDFELWRLVTGHLVHLGLSHFTLNVAGLVLVWLLVGTALDFLAWLLVASASIAAIDAGLWMFSPALQWYVGLSGVLHGLLAAGIVASLRERRVDTVLLGVGLLAKLTYEQFVGPLPGSEGATGDAVVVDAHLYGAIGGAIIATILIRVRRTAPI